jgi:hypothetical protein
VVDRPPCRRRRLSRRPHTSAKRAEISPRVKPLADTERTERSSASTPFSRRRRLGGTMTCSTAVAE